MRQLSLIDNLSGARFSPCRTWRYALWRKWSDETPICFIGLNPSTADETQPDPTITRIINFCKAWGGGGLIMLNLFGKRDTKPKDCFAFHDPVGPENDAAILEYTAQCEIIVAAWGVHGGKLGRGEKVCRMINRPLRCLRLTKHGYPEHPLYVPAKVKPITYWTP